MQALLLKIRKKKDFDLIFKKGKSIKADMLLVKYLRHGQESRVAFMVSQKVSKKAVVRNKVRRRLSEIIKKNTLPAADILFIALPGIEKKEFTELEQLVGRALNTIK